MFISKNPKFRVIAVFFSLKSIRIIRSNDRTNRKKYLK